MLVYDWMWWDTQPIRLLAYNSFPTTLCRKLLFILLFLLACQSQLIDVFWLVGCFSKRWSGCYVNQIFKCQYKNWMCAEVCRGEWKGWGFYVNQISKCQYMIGCVHRYTEVSGGGWEKSGFYVNQILKCQYMIGCGGDTQPIRLLAYNSFPTTLCRKLLFILLFLLARQSQLIDVFWLVGCFSKRWSGCYVNQIFKCQYKNWMCAEVCRGEWKGWGFMLIRFLNASI